MKPKISPLIMILMIFVVIMAGIALKLIIDKTKSDSANNGKTKVAEILPQLDLSTNTDEKYQKTIVITINATTEDEAGIDSIIFPDGSINRSNHATYEVKQNGTYTFKAKGKNGQMASASIEVGNLQEASATEPYMPTGFSHVEGEVENGYVIQDSFGNQFVWVPVKSGKMTRNTMLDKDYDESNNTASALVNSVAQNYGFYIARYEASLYEKEGEKTASSIANASPWTNITYSEAAEVANKASSVFGYDGYQTAIMNSYAWDTTLEWLDSCFENYSTNTSYGNYSGNIQNTGVTESDRKNNICDLAGNVREWTTEIYKVKPATTNSSSKNKKKNTTNEQTVAETVTYRVVRGGGANLSRTASSHTGYKENMTDYYWGFRMILYQ